mmetsp:Transcript_37475/g.38895  ORF Transcript_37475/g.38895 Transcript_37475/m.38895 type:complete len:229 (+) Transcript_37475:128-814(+)
MLLFLFRVYLLLLIFFILSFLFNVFSFSLFLSALKAAAWDDFFFIPSLMLTILLLLWVILDIRVLLIFSTCSIFNEGLFSLRFFLSELRACLLPWLFKLLFLSRPSIIFLLSDSLSSVSLKSLSFLKVNVFFELFNFASFSIRSETLFASNGKLLFTDLFTTTLFFFVELLFTRDPKSTILVDGDSWSKFNPIFFFISSSMEIELLLIWFLFKSAVSFSLFASIEFPP